jgi:acetylornithine deacetylase/succinyl-diaminopimelate desuccinylase-like protein
MDHIPSTLELLQDLIRIDSQNPPGNEQGMVDYIAEYCKKLGIEYTIYTYAENRSNLFITFGSGSQRPLTLLGHLDTVRFDSAAWTYPPLGGEIHDNHLYGRGALDMKYFVAAAMTIAGRLHAMQDRLDGPVNVLFTADEETGSSQGIRKVLQEDKVRDAVAGSLVLNEGGGFATFHGRKLTYLFETGQKSVARLRVSIPELPDTNPYFPTLSHEKILVQVVKRLDALDLDTSLPRSVQDLQRVFLDEGTSLSASDRRLFETMSESMITPTIIHGGSRNKQVPEGLKATIDFDCRLLPNMGRQEFLDAIEKAIGDLPVRIELTSFSQGYEATVGPDLVRLLEAALQKHDPEIASLVPFITPGSNDGKYLKPLGCDVLGFAPLSSGQPFSAIMPLMHGVDERISLASLTFCEQVLQDVCLAYLTGDSIRE